MQLPEHRENRHAPCEFDDCDEAARFTFAVGIGSFVPTRDTLRLCDDHAAYLRRIVDDEDGPGQWNFFASCGLVSVGGPSRTGSWPAPSAVVAVPGLVESQTRYQKGSET